MIFNPWLTGVLLLFKIMLPFALVAIVFGVINRWLGLQDTKSFLLVFALTDVMTLNFFFLVRDEGSWQDIGMSISHFAATNGMIFFQLLLLAFSQFVLRKTKVERREIKRD